MLVRSTHIIGSKMKYDNIGFRVNFMLVRSTHIIGSKMKYDNIGFRVTFMLVRFTHIIGSKMKYDNIVLWVFVLGLWGLCIFLLPGFTPLLHTE